MLLLHLCVAFVPSFFSLAQATPQNFDATDTCTHFNNFDLTFALNAMLRTAMPDVFSRINGCLCVSDIAGFINSNPSATFAKTLTSTSQVISVLTGIVTDSGQVCTYPAYSVPLCNAQNVCNYVCEMGHSKCSDGSCAYSCPSSRARRSLEQQLMREFQCPTGWEVCGGFTNAFSYECIDTQNTLDSCGGCLYPFFGHLATGRDCTEINGVDAVSCQKGICYVESCMEGMKVSANHQYCD